MKSQLLTGLLFVTALGTFAINADALVTTAGTDWRGASPADNALVQPGVVGLENTGSAQATVIGAVKREPSTAPDGSQVVTLEFYNPGGVNFNGTVWAYNSNQSIFGTQSFTVSGNPNRDPVGWVSKSMTFSSAQVGNSSYYEAVVYLPPGATIYGGYAN
jgi:hypothetical protein